MTHPPDPANDATLPPTASGGAGGPNRWDGRVPWRLGRYRVERKLGEGGMGAVYQAHDEQLDRAVALKIPLLREGVNDPLYPRFLREGRSVAGLRHPNICPVYDLGEIDGVPFLSMALIRGKPLADRVGPGRPVPVREAVEITLKVARAMAAAHRLGVIHRDLKPVNVLMDEAGEPIVLDFGLARRVESVSQLTVHGQVMGTPVYMPPEQFNGEIERMGPGCDIYSLGVVMYELLCGVVPFQGDLIALASQVMCDPPPPLGVRRPGVDPKLERICRKALEKRPEDRWPTMAAFADALADWLAAQPPAAGGGLLTLRVESTPLAYRAAPGQTAVTVGRQRRRPGEPAGAGNDFVVRVAGDDALSTRISRRHLEITRTIGGYAVTDRSSAGTLHNGHPLPAGRPVPLADGDRLVLAGAVTLVVGFADHARSAPVAGEVTVDHEAARMMLEATLGEVVRID